MAIKTLAGRYGQHRADIHVVPVITAGAYTVNFALGGMMKFPLASHGTDNSGAGSGVVECLRIVDRAKQNVPLELWLFDRAFTPVADNAAFAVSDADMENWVGTIPIAAANYSNANTQGAANVYPVELPYITAGADLYGQIVIRGAVAPTYNSTGDIRVRLSVRRD